MRAVWDNIRCGRRLYGGLSQSAGIRCGKEIISAFGNALDSKIEVKS